MQGLAAGREDTTVSGYRGRRAQFLPDNTFADHVDVLRDARTQVPARFPIPMIVRVTSHTYSAVTSLGAAFLVLLTLSSR
jgi:hypothetical protein